MVADKWQQLQVDVGEWSDATFPQPILAKNKAAHLVEEAQEVYEDPDDIMEYADCIMLLLDAARISGFSAEDLYQATLKKLEINKARKWGERDERGVVNHVD